MQKVEVFLLCALVLMAARFTEATLKQSSSTKTYTIKTEGGPIEVTETKITETEASDSWGSSFKGLLSDTKEGSMSVSDLGGSLVLAIDKTVVSEGIKKFILDTIKKLPVTSNGIKIGFVEYTDKPRTVVSLKQGSSIDQVMVQLQRELDSRRGAKSTAGGKIYDFVGLQAAYNELQQFGKAAAPRIIVLLSSGRDANVAKTKEWREKLMKEWVSLSEVYIDSSSDSFTVKVSGSEKSTDKSLDESTFMTSILKSYSLSTIEYYKKIYGEVWEFYIILKHYKKTYPKDWRKQIEIWFKKKYGSLDKFSAYLSRTSSKGGVAISPEAAAILKYKAKYGAKWEQYFLIWKYKKLFGAAWKTHYEQHLMKQKYGKNWFFEWEKVQFKNKYGAKWEPHYVQWYFKKYRGARWIYSWMKWQFRQKHKGRSKEYINEFMRWYYKYTKRGDKAYESWRAETKDINSDESDRRFRWFYYNLVFQKREALTKYNKWLYRKLYGKGFLTKYNAWLQVFNNNRNWINDYNEANTKLSYSTSTQIVRTNWFKKRYGNNWNWYYTRHLYQRTYGRQWRGYFNTWLQNEWKKPSPSLIRRPIKWFQTRYGVNWNWYYTRLLYQRTYGRQWTGYFNTWLQNEWKKPSPSLIRRPIKWFRWKPAPRGPWRIPQRTVLGRPWTNKVVRNVKIG